jgi:hypothetical protein
MRQDWDAVLNAYSLCRAYTGCPLTSSPEPMPLLISTWEFRQVGRGRLSLVIGQAEAVVQGAGDSVIWEVYHQSTGRRVAGGQVDRRWGAPARVLAAVAMMAEAFADGSAADDVPADARPDAER